MSLEEFKTIFWWEYIHRLWGRLIGVVFVVPLAWFWWRGQIDRPLGKKLLAALALGSAQGALGWFMVASGIAERAAVSQYSLTAPLALARADERRVGTECVSTCRSRRLPQHSKNNTSICTTYLIQLN